MVAGNDGRSVHHRAELEKAIARIQVKLDELKHTCMACGTVYVERPCPTCFPQDQLGGA